MKQLRQNTLFAAILISGVPSTATEYDEMAGQVGACVDAAVDETVYRGWLAKYRPAVIEAVEKKTGIAKLGPTEEDKSIPVEKDTVYIKRILAEGALSEEEYQLLAQEVADSIPFAINYASGGRIAKKYLENADKLIETINNEKNGDYSRLVANLSERNPGFQFLYEGDGTTPTRESIASGLKLEEERVAREAASSMLS